MKRLSHRLRRGPVASRLVFAVRVRLSARKHESLLTVTCTNKGHTAPYACAFSMLPTLDCDPESCCPLWGQFAGVISEPLEVDCAAGSRVVRAVVDGWMIWTGLGGVAVIAEIMG